MKVYSEFYFQHISESDRMFPCFFCLMNCGILQITKAFSTNEFIDRLVAWYQGSTAGEALATLKNSGA